VGEPSITTHTIPVCHAHSDDRLAVLGAQHAALMRVRRDYHPHWMMFVLQHVPWSEAYCQFLQFYVSFLGFVSLRCQTHFKVADSKIRKWFEMKTNEQTGISTCSVRYGDTMKGVETAQHTDANMAREDASFLAMTQVQSQYPHCYLVSPFFLSL
jgi:hypothetical protein